MQYLERRAELLAEAQTKNECAAKALSEGKLALAEAFYRRATDRLDAANALRVQA